SPFNNSHCTFFARSALRSAPSITAMPFAPRLCLAPRAGQPRPPLEALQTPPRPTAEEPAESTCRTPIAPALQAPLEPVAPPPPRPPRPYLFQPSRRRHAEPPPPPRCFLGGASLRRLPCRQAGAPVVTRRWLLGTPLPPDLADEGHAVVAYLRSDAPNDEKANRAFHFIYAVGEAALA